MENMKQTVFAGHDSVLQCISKCVNIAQHYFSGSVHLKTVNFNFLLILRKRTLAFKVLHFFPSLK